MRHGTAKHLKLVQRRRRRRLRAHDDATFYRTRARNALDRAGHYGIGISLSRSVIGEPFEQVRMREALVTLRYQAPIILPADVLMEHVTSKAAARKATDVLFAELKLEARRWMRRRAPVRHRTWKDI